MTDSTQSAAGGTPEGGGPGVPEVPFSRPSVAATADHGALKLVEAFRAAQRAVFLKQAAVLALAGTLLWVLLALAVSLRAPAVGRWLLLLSAFPGVALFWWLGPARATRRVGNAQATARSVGALAPELSLDLLAAVELSQALGERHDFSPGLAKAFIAEVNARAARQNVDALVDKRPLMRGILVLAVVAGLSLGFVVLKRVPLEQALTQAFSSVAAAVAKRVPITGDFELTYRYPAYTGLPMKTVQGTGDITAPIGTQVGVKTRADRDIDSAAFEVNGQRVAATKTGRDVQGEFVVTATGQYHVLFLEGDRVVAEGPDLPIQAEVDRVPQVHLTAPADGIELDPDKLRVNVKYDADDDFGITGMDLVYRPTGGTEARVALRPDDGRVTRGEYMWDLGSLQLKAGQVLSYYVEARDNDGAGVKKGVSKTQTIRIYSSAEHRREALAKAEALWERLVLHLADRLETGDRVAPMTLEVTQKGATVDQRAGALSQDLAEFVNEQLKERDPLEEVISAVANIRAELDKDNSSIAMQRAVLLRRTDDATRRMLSPRLAGHVALDVTHSEKNVLYLESLLDRQKLSALKDLAKELRQERQELSKVLEEYKNTLDPKLQQQLLDQMNDLRKRMMELQQRMSELSKGIRDEHINREALREMMDEQDMGASLDDVEKLIREGKADEAMKKMQELAMQMDEFLNNLDEAGDKADENSDPELSAKFQEFNENLQKTIEQQEQLSEKTRQLRDRYREQAKERVKKDGESVKKELLPRLEELEKSLKSDPPAALGSQMDAMRERAMKNAQETKQALESNQFDLALDAAQDLEKSAQALKELTENQRRMDEMFQNPPEVKKASRQLDEKRGRDKERAEEIAQRLEKLFPQNGQQMTESDRQQMNEQANAQKKLGQQTGDLQQQMDEIGERAPIFDESAKQQMEQAGQRMDSAGQKLGKKDANRGYGEQQGALQMLKGLQQAMQQQAQRGGGKGKGLPMPFGRGGRSSGRGNQDEKIEIPDEDPNGAPREYRKDVMDAMKQGAPERYKEQNKKYYEELVK